MKILHTADWHIGRKLNGFSLLEEQQDAFSQLLEVAIKEEVAAIVIAGDLYDRSNPSAEAVQVLQDMLIKLNLEHRFPVFAISGNHDSPTRLNVGSPWMQPNQFYLTTKIEEASSPIEFQDLQLFLLPYFEPFHAREYFGDESIRDIQTGVQLMVEKMSENFDSSKRQLLVSHFFVAGSTKEESETTLEVGGLANVTQDTFTAFDYVALGHLHYQDALKHGDKVKYSGSLLKYSLSEMNQEKGFRIVDIPEDKTQPVTSRFIAIKPLRDVQKITGNFATLCQPESYQKTDREAYTGIVLEDQTVIDNAIGQLREIYPRLIQLELAALKTQQTNSGILQEETIKELDATQLVQSYYQEVMSEPLSEKQQAWLEQAILEETKES